MDETRYHSVADAALDHCFNRLETAFESGVIDDLELQDGILTITAADRTYILSKHAASSQLWYASPTLGGLHFRLHENGRWQLPDGRTLYEVLSSDLATFEVAL